MIRLVQLHLPGHPCHGHRQIMHGGSLAVLWTSGDLGHWTAADDLYFVDLAPTGQRSLDGAAEIVAPTAPLPERAR